jgi:hypothetical protein
LRQKDCRLTGGVATAHDNYFFTATQLRLQMRGPVIDAGTLKLRELFEPEHKPADLTWKTG